MASASDPRLSAEGEADDTCRDARGRDLGSF